MKKAKTVRSPLLVGTWDLLSKLGYSADGPAVLGYDPAYADTFGPAHLRRRLAAALGKDQVAIPLDVRAVYPCSEANARSEWCKDAMTPDQVTRVVSAYLRAQRLGELGPTTYASPGLATRGTAYMRGRVSFSYYGHRAVGTLEPGESEVAAAAIDEARHWARYGFCFERFLGAHAPHPPMVVTEASSAIQATVIGASSLTGELVKSFAPMVSKRLHGAATARPPHADVDPMTLLSLSELAAEAARRLKVRGFWAINMAETTRGWVVVDVWPVAAPFEGRYFGALMSRQDDDVVDLARRILKAPDHTPEDET